MEMLVSDAQSEKSLAPVFEINRVILAFSVKKPTKRALFSSASHFLGVSKFNFPWELS